MTLLYLLYDLIPIQNPEYFQNGFKLFSLHKSLLKLCLGFDIIFCISASVKQDLVDLVSEQALTLQAELEVIPLGVSSANVNQKSMSLTKDPGEKYLLQVGTLEPRKGHVGVLEAMPYVWERDPSVRLVIVGKLGWLSEDIVKLIQNNAESGNKVTWISNADDEVLDFYYENSDLLIMSSYAEGYGLPLIEASKHGLPKLARDIPVFREVSPSNTWFFSADDPKSLGIEILTAMKQQKYPAAQLPGDWSKAALIIQNRV